MARKRDQPPDSVHHPLFARFFEKIGAYAGKLGQNEHRTQLLKDVSGSVIEVGAGNGLNFPFYPVEVDRVLAVEPEAYFRGKAREAARNVEVPIQVIDGLAGSLPVDDHEFDVGVFCLVLCSVPDQRAALDDMFRVIKPGGELRFYEHVEAEKPRVRKLQGALEPIWKRAAGGCHLTRDTASAIAEAGFEMTDWQKVEFKPDVLATPVALHILGRARRP
jgi:ubiquinone/menaquinone biosynthesis C-methylase UbiE